MTPRNPTSKNWTALPSEFREKAALVFKQNFKDESKIGEFVIDGRIYPSEIVMRAGFVEKGRLKQANFEVSMDHSPDQQAMEKLFLGIDVLGSVFESHFDLLREDEVDDVEYPMNWEEYEFEDKTVHLRFSTTNTELEAEANRLLGISEESLGEALFVEDAGEVSEDALTRAMIDSELAQEVSKSIREGRYVPKLDETQLEAQEKQAEDLH